VLNDGTGFSGADGVHSHMTNSRLTDPEVLEFRFPVVLEDFHIRRGSGGKGQYSLFGGEDGQLGKTEIRRGDGQVEKLEGCDQAILAAGDAVIITTPTGGGYGKPV